MGVSGVSGVSGRAVLAVDGGNSKTDVVVVGLDGRVLGAARGDGFQPQSVGVRAAVEALDPLLRSALAAAGNPAVTQVTGALAGADLPQEERLLTEALAARGWGARTEVVNDTFAILRAGLPDAPGGGAPATSGVAVVCGAGINCAGRRADGRVHRFAALGELSGDWGGGGGLARAALWHAARAEDGRGPDTELARALPGYFGRERVEQLVEAFHLGGLDPCRRYELTPVLFEVAASGDPVAHRLVERQAEEVALLATVALTRLELLGEPTPVVLGGGVLAARHPQLHEGVTRRLAERAPRAEPRVIEVPPVVGAALLALDGVGAPPPAYAALRAHHRV
ncbi:N-acetylglucosamine kinase [Streptomyces alkaliterrae]|uniref:ATPase n=1 Tax=Streptomyces alkaliterrae TaxID=2213162 RepID=A0A5P0YR05_9ACTN|nr:BadF/BadG/BcrA/BcrD ATPase family protein [Streptomyces alkaliterrae]MBB1259631.1 ATPase [Streptomyces alkaliterrae]MQS00969.1 ATPase [Streptomyces alkaliterrae]